jgi:hypothetical protein
LLALWFGLPFAAVLPGGVALLLIGCFDPESLAFAEPFEVRIVHAQLQSLRREDSLSSHFAG